MNAENIILCGVWLGPVKPFMDALLGPIVSNLNRLSTEGLVINTLIGKHISRLKLVMGVFDLPAKAAVLNMKQFNGLHGCSVCVHPSKRLANNARVYLPNPSYKERTHAQIVKDGESAESTSTSVQGVKGVSPLSSGLDLVASIPIDYMHAVLEGVTKHLTSHWFDSKFHSQPVYIGRHRKQVDAEFLKQRPPSEFSRSPRSIIKHFKYWKASEIRNWLCFTHYQFYLTFCLACTGTIMHSLYVQCMFC